MRFLQTKYYPVCVTEGIIYNDPKTRERDCGLGNPIYWKMHAIGIKGARLNKYAFYQAYAVQPPLQFAEHG